MALSRTAKFYRDNPEARKKHNDYQKKFNKKPNEVKRRVFDNKKNREFGTYGNYDGLDVSHLPDGKIGLESEKKNRGSKTNTEGDKRARGKERRSLKKEERRKRKEDRITEREQRKKQRRK
jgi:hypothetical protein|tara:strand:+ start:1839 stop:2201 length:363 start_codon:yes stop_codon:yes gene_type:complete